MHACIMYIKKVTKAVQFEYKKRSVNPIFREPGVNLKFAHGEKKSSQEERMQRLQDIEKNRLERMLRRQYQRKRATQQFYKSMQMLQANAKRDKDEPFEDYSIFLYRQTAPDFKDRVKDLEQKILYPVSEPITPYPLGVTCLADSPVFDRFYNTTDL